jgi:CheY-like chemotaxis protein
MTGLHNPRSSGKRCILLIDEDENLLSLLQHSLQQFGFEVLGAATGAQALDFISKRAVDLIILDYRLPDIDGEAIITAVRRATPFTPIMMYSAALEQIPARVLALVDEFVSKQEPISTLLYYVPRVSVKPQEPRRAFPRYPVHVPFAVVNDAGGVLFRGESNSLSEGGVGGFIDGQLPPGKLVRLQLKLTSDVSLHPRASVRYSIAAHHGFEFLDLTITQLQSIRRSLPS